MAASGYSIAQIENIAAGDNVNNIIANKPGVKLPAGLNIVDIYLTREAVGVEFNVTIGGSNVYPQPGPANIDTVQGSLPSTHDDKVITAVAQGGDEIVIAASNGSGGALEARALVKVMPVDDAMIISAKNIRLNQGS